MVQWGDLQVLYQRLGVVDVRLDAVGHQDTVYMIAAIGGGGQRRHGGAVLAAGDADDGGAAVAGFHLGVHPLQKAGQLQLGVKFHKRVLPSLFFWSYCSAEKRHLQELSQQTGDILQRQAPLKGQG